ncbi:MAG: hypothetical protein QF371_10105, partial [Flavobacteriales bacterium]|nr:hypothetical protein [Flavobacteriales bacterium]
FLIVEEQRNGALFFDKIKHRHLAYLEIAPSSFQAKSIMEMKSEFINFLSVDSTVSDTHKAILLNGFGTSMEMIGSKLGLNESELLEVTAKHYPGSVMLMYMTIRYNRYSYLRRLMYSGNSYNVDT